MINEKDMTGKRVIGTIFSEHSPEGPVYRTFYGGFGVENEYPEADEANLIVFNEDFLAANDFYEPDENQDITNHNSTTNDNKRILNESNRLITGLRLSIATPLHRQFLKSALKRLASGFRKKLKWSLEN